MSATRVEFTAEAAGKRLDRVLADRLEISRARVRHLLEVGRIRQGQKTLQLSAKSHSVSAGEIFEIDGALRAEDERPVPRADLDWQLQGQGPGYLVVDKPAGRPVHPLRPDQEETVLNAIVARVPEIEGVGEGGLRSGVVHRLDVETSGVLIFATEAATWKRLRGAFAEHRVDKRYRALVAGRFEKPRRVDLSLEVTRHEPARVSVVDAGSGKGRACRQRVTPLRVFEESTLVEVRLETGFLHQIRASMASLGHPVLGDPLYGGAERIAGFEVARLMLHAERVAVDEIDVSAPPPSDFEGLVARLDVAKDD